MDLDQKIKFRAVSLSTQAIEHAIQTTHCGAAGRKRFVRHGVGHPHGIVVLAVMQTGWTETKQDARSRLLVTCASKHFSHLHKLAHLFII